MSKLCDHTSVGVIVTDIDGKLALLKRAKFPVGIAPPAGHIDDHGSPEQAALDEVEEELGLIIDPADLTPTAVRERRLAMPCRRENGDYHIWTVYTADQFLGDLAPSPDETKGAGWYTKKQLQQLADRTKAYQAGKISEDEWQKDPGLEEIWMVWMTELKYIK